MIYLTTGTPDAKLEGERVTISFPSGKDTLEIALTYHEAMNLAAIISIRAGRGIQAANIAAEPEAQIIAFPREVPSLVRRELKAREILSLAASIGTHG